ncbi:MAG: IS1380 family transposase [Dehalococcoidia bacterium]|nr:IS1380 family transposase [Dehalococcoidia bacterium]
MRLLHSARNTSALFDDPNLVSCAGLVPVMRLAQDCDFAALVAEQVKMSVAVGANTALKVPAIVAGMIAGADSIDDLDVLRHGGMDKLFGGVRAPSTLGSFLRGFDWGNVRQLDVVSRRLLNELAARTPVLSDANVLAHLDIDSAQRRVYGHAKQGAGFGAAKVGGYTLRLRGLNPLLAAVSTPTRAPVLVGTRLRGGSANSARGAASFTAEAITTARAAGATGLLIARMDSAFYNGATIAACRRNGVRFSVTARMDKKITKAIAGIPDHAWTPIKYPNAIYDEDEQRWISDAEVAETSYTAFAGNRKHRVTARLIVRRVRRLAPPAQGELLPAWRHHAIFTDSPLPMLAAETDHRDHAIIEQVIADLIDGPLAHLPSGDFAANAAWLSCAAIAHNLLRAAATLASRRHGKARAATVRHELINIPARLAHRGRDQLILHLPQDWPWRDAFEGAFDTTHRAPPARAA